MLRNRRIGSLVEQCWKVNCQGRRKRETKRNATELVTGNKQRVHPLSRSWHMSEKELLCLDFVHVYFVLISIYKTARTLHLYINKSDVIMWEKNF